MDFNFLTGYMDKTVGVDVLYNKALDVSNRLPEEYVFFEVGCYRGGSAVAIMMAIKDSKFPKRWMFTIDPYGHKPFELGNEIVEPVDYGEECYRHAMKFMSNYAFDNKLNHYHFRMTFNDFYKTFGQYDKLPIDFWYEREKIKSLKAGFTYLDGDHTPNNVYKEFRYFDGITPSGGAIVIDDFPYWIGKYNEIDKVVHGGNHDNFRAYYDKN